jgi:2-oxo-hept-3-ene-1,7-dioate hydratase
MLNSDTITALARELQTARTTRTPIRQLSARHPDMRIEDGYAIQREWVRLELAAGRRIRGRKIGLTSRAMQLASGITEPDFAPLMDDMFFEPGTDIAAAQFIMPRIEVELAFVLGRPLQGPNCTLFDVLAATDHVCPALEIIDSRVQPVDPETQSSRKVFDTISDFAANAGILLGGRPVRPHEVDLRWVSALLYKNSVIEESGVAAAVLNHPANGVAWLANKIAPYGEQLNAGDIVLGGSFTRPVTVAAGDSFHADYGPLGSIACRFI